MKRTNRIIAWLLAVAMTLSLCTFAAAEETTRESLMQTAAEVFAAQESPAEWVLFDLAAYGTEISDAKKDAYVESAVAAITKENAAITEYAKAEIILNVLGVDTTALETADGKTVSNPENFESITEFSTYSDAIWTLFADELDSVTLTDAQLKAAVAKIAACANGSGMLFGSYGDYTYDDPDSTGAAVGALYRLVNDGDTYGANAIYSKMLTALSDAQLSSGSYGSACTDAFVIMGLCAAGIDPDSDNRFVKGENSLIDGLMSYAIEGGFAGYDGGLDLAWSTEQGFRALIAYESFVENGKKAFSIYSDVTSVSDEGENSGNQGDSTSGGLVGDEGVSDSVEDENSGNQGDSTSGGLIGDESVSDSTITVSFEMKTHKETWMSRMNVTVSSGTSVRDLIEKVFSENGVTSEGLDSGYLKSVTYDRETWGEFDAGENSGWQYTVNGSLPQTGIASYKLKDGDAVALVYTADYTNGALSSGNGESEDNKTCEDDSAEGEETSIWENPFTDVNENNWFVSAVQFVCERGLMNGMTGITFAPDGTLTRAMFVTVLYRMEGSPDTGSEAFDDVDGNAWYGEAVAWASEKGIVNGTSATTFSPDAPVTREQMAALAYRYAGYKDKAETAESEMSFTDADKISEYAKESAAWANSAGIMTGANGAFNPTESSKRSEAAAVFMRLYNAING